ncbi:MAG TPA: YceI family protein [Gemmatimonadaceae bacterium]|nr:YceI family protein [Gemmatimonadaceae bacterium]
MQRRFLAASVALLVIGVSAVGVAAARSSASAATVQPAVPQQGPTRYVLAPKGNSARYFVREQLASVNFPSDAVGVTDSLTGGITIDDKGQVVPAESKFVANISYLKSDRDMRDGFIRRRTMETDKYPTVTLVPKEIKGLTMPLATSGRVSFTVLGDLTVKGVTRPTTWSVTAGVRNGAVRGTASTGFTFADFQLEKPKVMSILSVADSIHLVYDFDLVPAGSEAAAANR